MLGDAFLHQNTWKAKCSFMLDLGVGGREPEVGPASAQKMHNCQKESLEKEEQLVLKENQGEFQA